MDPPVLQFYPHPRNLLTRGQTEDCRFWQLVLLTDSGLRNDPNTAELSKLIWKFRVCADVTPRDVLETIGLDSRAKVGLYSEKCTRWETRPDCDWIFILPNGPAMAMDQPLVPLNYQDELNQSRFRIRILGDLVFKKANDEQESDKSGEINDEEVEVESSLMVYVLECAKGKFYVGKTRNPKFRIDDHFDAQGCKCVYSLSLSLSLSVSLSI
jgi:hypothetical protein